MQNKQNHGQETSYSLPSGKVLQKCHKRDSRSWQTLTQKCQKCHRVI